METVEETFDETLDEYGFCVREAHAEAPREPPSLKQQAALSPVSGREQAYRASHRLSQADLKLWRERWAAAVRGSAWGGRLPPWVVALGRSRMSRVPPEAPPPLVATRQGQSGS